MTVDELVAAGPRWTAQQRELWADLFVNFCESITGKTIEEHSGGRSYPEEQLRSDISLAADLADYAVAQHAYRSVKHQPEVKQRARKVRR